MNRILAGLLAALPLSLLGILYMVLRGKEMIKLVNQSDSEGASFSEKQWFVLFLVSMALAPFVFGVIAALVYGWVGNWKTFIGLAIGIAVLLSILAYTSRSPMPFTKTIMNFLVAIDLGALLPFLAKS